MSTATWPRPWVTRAPGRVRSRWLWQATGVLTAGGLTVSVYSTVEHYTVSTTLACPDTGVVYCLKVITSPQSTVAGVPLAVPRLVYFLGMCGPAAPPLWLCHERGVRKGRLRLPGIGVIEVIYLIYVELFVVDAICLWCTAVHVLTVAQFILTAYREVIEPA